MTLISDVTVSLHITEPSESTLREIIFPRRVSTYLTGRSGSPNPS